MHTIPLPLIILATAAYTGLLFWIAWTGDRKADRDGETARRSPNTYALALAVYCTSWTYYGAVGSAERSGWDYLPIYLGPALVFLFLPRLLRRIALVTRRESITSLADFLSARYGRSQSLAVAATLAALVGALPYIALQLQSIAMSLEATTAAPETMSHRPAPGTTFAIAAALAVFAILFGTRRPDATRQNAGLLRVLAFEAIVKLAALGAVAALSIALLLGADLPDWPAATERFAIHPGPALDFVTLTLLSMAAIIALPRQFHVAFIERRDNADLVRAQWMFPAYLLLTSAVVIPITLAGSQLLPAETPGDLFVLGLPQSQGNALLTLIVFLGGFSAATGMVIISAIAVSTMVTNDLLVPTLLRTRMMQRAGADIGPIIVRLRRAVIVVIMLLAWLYFNSAHGSAALAEIGQLSFVAAAQFAPALLGAVLWPHGHRNGALAGLIVGMAVWAYTLFVPALIGIDTLRAAQFSGLIDPYGLLGLSGPEPITHGALWSVGLNTLVFISVSMMSATRLRDRVQSVVFTGEPAKGALATGGPTAMAAVDTTVGDLQALASRFLQPEAVADALESFAAQHDISIEPDEKADWRLVQRTERLLASALGAPSARIVLASALADQAVRLQDVLAILDEKTHAARFDRHLLQSTLENLTVGVQVVDGDQRLIAWNSAYMDIFRYPYGMIRVGTPVAETIRYNAETGFLGPGEADGLVAERLGHMREGRASVLERRTSDGRVIRIAGNPMPGGGYVTVFSDITEDRRREAELEEINETLEQRVRERTAELEAVAVDRDKALREAEGANASKTRFLAAASHDLMQPLNAARLFVGSLSASETLSTEERRALAEKADRAIDSANQLLTGLLDISRLDHGGREPRVNRLPLGPLLEDLVDEAAPMAEAAGLSLRLVPTSLAVFADADFLQSILRNFISNARRYTRKGGIVVGARRRGDDVRVEIWDTGPGVPKDKQSAIFEEFRRLDDLDNSGVRGAGLGLAVASRMAALMGAQIGLRSRPGRGSVFSVALPRAAIRSGTSLRPPGPTSDRSHGELAGLQVLCVDDEISILDAMQGLVRQWGGSALTAQTGAQAVEASRGQRLDAVIVDYQLADGETGFDVIDALARVRPTMPPVGIVTANRSEAVRSRASERGIRLIHKPVTADALHDFLAQSGKAGRPAAAE